MFGEKIKSKKRFFNFYLLVCKQLQVMSKSVIGLLNMLPETEIGGIAILKIQLIFNKDGNYFLEYD